MDTKGVPTIHVQFLFCLVLFKFSQSCSLITCLDKEVRPSDRDCNSVCLMEKLKSISAQLSVYLNDKLIMKRKGLGFLLRF